LEQIDRAEFERRAKTIGQELAQLIPSAHPDAAKIVPYLSDIPALWIQLSWEEQRGILSALFSGIYMDRESRIRRVVAPAPFDTLLGLPEDGIWLPGCWTEHIQGSWSGVHSATAGPTWHGALSPEVN
jgi:hypothetical protein